MSDFKLNYRYTIHRLEKIVKSNFEIDYLKKMELELRNFELKFPTNKIKSTN